MISPLGLMATEGASTVNVLGMYLISSDAGASGTVVLYAPFYENHALKEYSNEQSLLDELARPGALQDWVLTRGSTTSGNLSQPAAKQPSSPI